MLLRLKLSYPDMWMGYFDRYDILISIKKNEAIIKMCLFHCFMTTIVQFTVANNQLYLMTYQI